MRKIERGLVLIVILFLFVVTHALLGCARAGYAPYPDPSPAPLTTSPATLQQCPYGGTQVTSGSSSVLVCDDYDRPVSPVCPKKRSIIIRLDVDIDHSSH